MDGETLNVITQRLGIVAKTMIENCHQSVRPFTFRTDHEPHTNYQKLPRTVVREAVEDFFLTARKMGGKNFDNEILEERQRQMKKWGAQDHNDYYWLGILTEEVGELADALLHKTMKEQRKEFFQAAAVSKAWLEAIDRAA